MSREKNYKNKKGSELRSEENTLKLLLVLGVLFFLLSIAIYLVTVLVASVPEGIDEVENLPLLTQWGIKIGGITAIEEHLGFWGNVTLGLAASAFISYFSLVVNYRRKRAAVISGLKRELHTIYKDYIRMILIIRAGENTVFINSKEQMDLYESGTSRHYYLEKVLFTLAGRVKCEILEFADHFNAEDIQNDGMAEMIKYLSKNVNKAASIVREFCFELVQQDINYAPDELTKEAIDAINTGDFEKVLDTKLKSIIAMDILDKWYKKVAERIQEVVDKEAFTSLIRKCGIKEVKEEALADMRETFGIVVDNYMSLIKGYENYYDVNRRVYTTLICSELFCENKNGEKKAGVLKLYRKLETGLMLSSEVSPEKRHEFNIAIFDLIGKYRYLEAHDLIKKTADEYNIDLSDKDAGGHE